MYLSIGDRTSGQGAIIDIEIGQIRGGQVAVAGQVERHCSGSIQDVLGLRMEVMRGENQDGQRQNVRTQQG